MYIYIYIGIAGKARIFWLSMWWYVSMGLRSSGKSCPGLHMDQAVKWEHFRGKIPEHDVFWTESGDSSMDFTRFYQQIRRDHHGNDGKQYFFGKTSWIGLFDTSISCHKRGNAQLSLYFWGVPRWVMKMRFHSPNQKIGLNPSTWAVWNLQNYGCNAAGFNQPYSNK